MTEHGEHGEQFIPEQVDEQIKHIEQSTQQEPTSRLMSDLRIVSQDYNEMSDRVWGRLLDHMEHTPARTQQRLNERIHVMSQIQPKPRRRFISWVTLIAAVILALLVTGSSIAIFQSAHSQLPNTLISNSSPAKSTPTRKPAITPTPTVTPLPAALCNANGQGDSGWDAICSTKQYTEIDQIHDLKGTSIHMYAGYADSNRIILAYTIQLTQTTLNQRMLQEATLSAQKGVNISIQASGGGFNDQKTMQNYEFLSTSLLSVANNITILHLHVDISYYTNSTEKTSFDFSLPFHRGHIININQTQTANGQPITLDHISISPTQTIIYVGGSQINPGMEFENSNNPITSPGYELNIGNWRSLGKAKLMNSAWNENNDKHQPLKGIELEINYPLLDKTGEWTLIIHHEAIPSATEDVVFNFKI